MNVNGKKLIVTGGGNGVGRELVFQLLEKGASVIAVDINQEALETTKQMTGNSAKLDLWQVDISKQDEVFEFAEEAIARHHRIDGIINNAGIIQPFVPLDSLSMDRIERVMNINFYGTLYMIKALLPHFKTLPEAHIVNVSSMGGFLPVPGQSVYGASKAAVKLLSEALGSELADTNVSVSVVIPGGIQTDIKKNSNIAHSTGAEDKGSKMILTPLQAASQIIRVIEKKKKKAYIGKDCKIMNFLYGIKPSLAMGLINKVMSVNEH